jgi:hypothetical protein
MTPPSTSSLNFDSDNAAGALSISVVGGGSLCIFANQRTYLIVDLLGVWVPTPDAPPPTDGPGPIPDEPENPDPPVGDVDAGIPTAEDAAQGDGGVGRRDAGPGSRLGGTCACAAGSSRHAGWPWLALAVLAGLASVAGRVRDRSRR